MNAQDSDLPSTRPYLIRAMHEWCVDGGFSPYLAVHVDASVKVPREFVNNGEIVLNISPEATQALRLGNDYIEFKARFGGVARDILVPVSHVVAIYARENGQGMAFPPPAAPVLQVVADHGGADVTPDAAPPASTDATPAGDAASGRSKTGGRPQLTRIK